MSATAIDRAVEGWHGYLRGGSDAELDALLDDDVVFHSPIVYTPQRGREIAAFYLRAARQALPGDPVPSDAAGSVLPGRAFRYTKEIRAGDTAALEFETTIDGTYVNGVDIIRCDREGRIIEFRVMVRPLQAVNLVQAQMAAQLERMTPTD
jgi:hypothetical protein